MGWSIEYPLGQNSDLSNAVSGGANAVLNPIGDLNKRLGLNLPTTVRIGGRDIGLNPRKQIEQTIKDLRAANDQAKNDFKNAGRVVDPVGAFGGKNVLGGTGLRDQSNQIVTNAIRNPASVVDPTGSFGGKNIVGTTGVRDAMKQVTDKYVGQDPRVLLDPLGFTGGAQMKLYDQENNPLGFSGDDVGNWRNASFLGGIITAIFFGGAALFGGEAGAGAGGAVEVESGAGAGGLSSGTITTTDLTASGVGIGAGGGAAAPAAAATPWFSNGVAGAAAATNIYGVITGKKSASDGIKGIFGDGSSPSDGSFLSDISDYLNGNSDGSAPTFSSPGISSSGGFSPALSSISPTTVAVWGGALLLGLAAFRKFA